MSGRISQGDQYSIAMTIRFNDEPLDVSNVDKILFATIKIIIDNK